MKKKSLIICILCFVMLLSGCSSVMDESLKAKGVMQTDKGVYEMSLVVTEPTLFTLFRSSIYICVKKIDGKGNVTCITASGKGRLKFSGIQVDKLDTYKVSEDKKLKDVDGFSIMFDTANSQKATNSEILKAMNITSETWTGPSKVLDIPTEFGTLQLTYFD